MAKDAQEDVKAQGAAKEEAPVEEHKSVKVTRYYLAAVLPADVVKTPNTARVTHLYVLPEGQKKPGVAVPLIESYPAVEVSEEFYKAALKAELPKPYQWDKERSKSVTTEE